MRAANIQQTQHLFNSSRRPSSRDAEAADSKTQLRKTRRTSRESTNGTRSVNAAQAIGKGWKYSPHQMAYPAYPSS